MGSGATDVPFGFLAAGRQPWLQKCLSVTKLSPLLRAVTLKFGHFRLARSLLVPPTP
jgi:hypothetical protein